MGVNARFNFKWVSMLVSSGTGLGLLLPLQVSKQQLSWHYKIAHKRHEYTVQIMFNPKQTERQQPQ